MFYLSNYRIKGNKKYVYLTSVHQAHRIKNRQDFNSRYKYLGTTNNLILAFNHHKYPAFLITMNNHCDCTKNTKSNNQPSRTRKLRRIIQQNIVHTIIYNVNSRIYDPNIILKRMITLQQQLSDFATNRYDFATRYDSLRVCYEPRSRQLVLQHICYVAFISALGLSVLDVKDPDWSWLLFI